MRGHHVRLLWEKGIWNLSLRLWASWLSDFESEYTVSYTYKTGSDKMWSHDRGKQKGPWEVTGMILNVWVPLLCKNFESTYCNSTCPVTAFCLFQHCFAPFHTWEFSTRSSLIRDGTDDHWTGNHLVSVSKNTNVLLTECTVNNTFVYYIVS